MDSSQHRTSTTRTPVESLRKGLLVLESLCQSREPRSLSELAEAMGWKRTTTYNVVKTLTLCGYAQNFGDGRYGPGWRVRNLGRVLWYRGRREGLARLRSLIGDIASELEESVVFAMLVDGQRRVLARADGTQVIRVDTDAMELDEKSLWSLVTGRVLAAFCSAEERSGLFSREALSGDVWPGVSDISSLEGALAGIRRAGLAESREQDVASLAVPVRDDDCGLLGSLGTYLPSFRYNGDRREDLIDGLRRNAGRLGPVLIDMFGSGGSGKTAFPGNATTHIQGDEVV